MSDAINPQETMPLVQSSGSLSNSNGNGVNNQQNLTISSNKSTLSTPQTPTTASSNSSSGITIQTTLPGSNSFVVGTKANPAIISDAPITDPGGNTTKQVNNL